MRKYIPFLSKPLVVPVIRLNGAIGVNGRSLSDNRIAKLVARAFSKGKPVAVALCINSPGGSPVQSSLIASRIRRFADEHKIPVHAFVEDVAASGGYWLATAADHIWVDPSSIVGSIGVISSGFGFNDLIARYGIERRVYTAGSAKSFSDPFKKQTPEDIARIQALLSQLHENFIAQVTSRRGKHLNPDIDIFNADIWLGQKAVDIGLADGVAHLEPKMKELYGDKVRFVPYEEKRNLFSRFGLKMSNDLTRNLLENTMTSVEERSLWSRYGL